MKPKKNITYILGAGASFNAVPVINNLQFHMSGYRGYFFEISPYSRKEFGLSEYFAFQDSTNKINLNWEPLSLLLNCLDYFSEKSRTYRTIDTFALSLKNGHATEYNLLKFVLNIFFTFWESGENTNKINPLSDSHYIDIDERYVYLASSMFLNNKMNMKIPDNMNFITWNYDTQLERALMLFLDEGKRNLVELNKYIPIYPLSPIENAKIIHLNGISGGYYNYKDEFNQFSVDNQSLKEYKLKYLAQYLTESHKGHGLKSGLNFIWDNDENEILKKLKYASLMLNKADEISVIGYSFPEFNRKFDSLMMESFNPEKQIYIQNSNFESSTFKEYFGDKFKNVKNLPYNKFYIPSDFYL